MEKKHEIQRKLTSNIVLMGGRIETLQVIGQELAQFLGYGCLNLEGWIENTHKRSVEDLIKDTTAELSEKVLEALLDAQKIHNHVVLLSLRLWQGESLDTVVKGIGPLILLDFPVQAYFVSDKKTQPRDPTLLFSEISGYLHGQPEKQKQFAELLGVSESICQNADFIVNDQYSTSEEVARGLKQLLVKKFFLKLQKKR